MSSELNDRWKALEHHHDEPFIEDGIIDPAAWDAAPRRVLFLLKEAYDLSEGRAGFDLRMMVRDKWKGPKGSTWWKMGYWAHLLHTIDPGHTPPYPSNTEAPRSEAARSAILASAVVNIRKSGGKTRSKDEVITKYAGLDADLLREQIDAIAPDIILAGGVWLPLQELWTPQRVSDRVHRIPVCPLINFWHPAARFHNKLLYFALGGIVQAAETSEPGILPRRRSKEA